MRRHVEGEACRPDDLRCKGPHRPDPAEVEARQIAERVAGVVKEEVYREVLPLVVLLRKLKEAR